MEQIPFQTAVHMLECIVTLAKFIVNKAENKADSETYETLQESLQACKDALENAELSSKLIELRPEFEAQLNTVSLMSTNIDVYEGWVNVANELKISRPTEIDADAFEAFTRLDIIADSL